MSDVTWHPIAETDEETPYRTATFNPDGTIKDEIVAMRRGTLWWLPDGSNFLRWKPTHWTEVIK